MSNNDYMTPNRNNNFMNNTKTYQLSPIHIFTKPNVLSPPISTLKTQCKKRNIPFEIHQNPRQLITLMSNARQKTFIVIQTPRQSATEFSYVFPEKFPFPKNSENIKIITYPSVLSNTNYDSYNDKLQILNLYERYMNGTQSTKIKLRKVHSSKDIKYQLTSSADIRGTKSPKKGKQIFFQKLLIHDPNISTQNGQYKILISSLQGIDNSIRIFKNSDIKDQVNLLKSAKLLLLIDQQNLSNVRSYIQKNKLQKKIDLLVFGNLIHPKRQLLSNNVYFASDNGFELLDQLSKMGFNKVGECRKIYGQLSTDRKNQFDMGNSYNNLQQSSLSSINNQNINNKNNREYKISTFSNNINDINHQNNSIDHPDLQRISQRSGASIFSFPSQQQRFMRHWIVAPDPTNPQGYKMQEEDKQQIEAQSLPMSKRMSRITNGKRQEDDQNFKAINSGPNDDNLNNHITFQQIRPTTQKQVIDLPIFTSSDSISTIPAKKVLKLTKKTQPQINLNHSKYQQSPSKVIQQTSDQYRGSNRQSIVYGQQYYHQNIDSINMTGNFNKIKDQSFDKIDPQQLKIIDGKTGELINQHNQKIITNSSSKALPANQLGYQNSTFQTFSNRTNPFVINGMTGDLDFQSEKRFKKTYIPVFEKSTPLNQSTTNIVSQQIFHKNVQPTATTLPQPQYTYHTHTTPSNKVQQVVYRPQTTYVRLNQQSGMNHYLPSNSSKGPNKIVIDNSINTNNNIRYYHSNNEAIRPYEYNINNYRYQKVNHLPYQTIYHRTQNQPISRYNEVPERRVSLSKGQTYHVKSSDQSYQPRIYQYGSNPNVYNTKSTTSYYQNEGYITKDPQVIERVYIKASDLPEYHEGKHETKRYSTYHSPSHTNYVSSSAYPYNYKTNHINNQNIQDQDPFHQKRSSHSRLSSNSRQKKGSILVSDGKKDPYSPYEQKGGDIFTVGQNFTTNAYNPHHHSIKTYTQQQYQKLIEQRQRNSNHNNYYSPRIIHQQRNFITTPREVRTNSRSQSPYNNIDYTKYEKNINQNGLVVYKQRVTNHHLLN